MADQIRIYRVLEYTGPAEAVERQVALSLTGEYRMPSGVTMRVATTGEAVADIARGAFSGLDVFEGYPGAERRLAQ